MAKYDHGGGCACGLQKVCDCKAGTVKGAAAMAEAPEKASPVSFDLATIKPPHGEMDGSGKMSPNLYRWMRKRWGSRFGGRGLEKIPSVYRDHEGCLWIGTMATDGWFTGSRLMRVLCNGARQEIWAIQPVQAKSFKLCANFWRAYRRVGRCAIDPAHKRWFMNDDNRWTLKGKTRTCRWCGKHKQRLRVRTETKRTTLKTWVKA